MNPAVRQLLTGGMSRADRDIRDRLSRLEVSPGRIIGFIGDSITNGSSATSAGVAFPTQSIHLAGALQFSVAGAVIAGVPGERSDQIQARLAGVLSQGVRVLVILAGTNDAGQGVTSATYGANMATMLSACQSANVRCVVVTVPPRSSAVATSTTRTLTSEYNAWINANAVTYGALVADAWTALKDGTGDLDATYDSGDGVHPNTLGHRRIAQSVSAKLQTFMRSLDGIVTTTASLNIVSNPLMTGTGTKPTGYSEQAGGTGTAPTYSIVDDASGFLDAGRWAEMDFDAVSGGTRRLACTLAGRWAVGDVICVTGKMQIEDVSGNWESSVVAGTAGVSINLVNQSAVALRNSSATGGAVGLNLGPMWYPVTVPSGTTAIILWCSVTLPAGAHIKARFGAIGAINVTRMNAATAFP